jgi:NDP-sugar pyrophosphorylase family protein
MSGESIGVRGPEFQAVIVVDYDNRLFPLTESIPTCLLPIANKKLLAYQLDMLVKSGVGGE